MFQGSNTDSINTRIVESTVECYNLTQEKKLHILVYVVRIRYSKCNIRAVSDYGAWRIASIHCLRRAKAAHE